MSVFYAERCRRRAVRGERGAARIQLSQMSVCYEGRWFRRGSDKMMVRWRAR